MLCCKIFWTSKGIQKSITNEKMLMKWKEITLVLQSTIVKLMLQSKDFGLGCNIFEPLNFSCTQHYVFHPLEGSEWDRGSFKVTEDAPIQRCSCSSPTATAVKKLGVTQKKRLHFCLFVLTSPRLLYKKSSMSFSFCTIVS